MKGLGRRAGTLPGCGICWILFRWYRFARPPATGWDAAGILIKRDHRTYLRKSAEPLCDLCALCGKNYETFHFSEIPQAFSSNLLCDPAALRDENPKRIRSGNLPGTSGDSPLAPLPGCGICGILFRWYRCARPPATGWDAAGIFGDLSLGAMGVFQCF